MKCRDIKKKFQSFIKNELDKKTVQEINTHLKECETCKKDYEFYKIYFKGISKIKPVKASDDLIRKLNEKIDNPKFLDKILMFISYNIKFNYKTLSIAVLLILAILIPVNYLNYNKKNKDNNLTYFAKKDFSDATEKKEVLKEQKKFSKETKRSEAISKPEQKIFQVTLLIIEQKNKNEENIRSLALDKTTPAERENTENYKKRKDADDEKSTSGPAKSENKKAASKLNLNENQNQLADNAQREIQEANKSDQLIQDQKNFIAIESLIKEYNGKIIQNEKDKENKNIYFEIPEDKYQEFISKIKSLGNTSITNDNKNNTNIKLNAIK